MSVDCAQGAEYSGALPRILWWSHVKHGEMPLPPQVLVFNMADGANRANPSGQEG